MVVGCPINIKENIDYKHLMKELKFSWGEVSCQHENQRITPEISIAKSKHEPTEFISNIFLCPKNMVAII